MVDAYRNITNQLPNMSKSQRKIAKYVLSNTDAVPFFTVGKLATMAGVSEATVVRFAYFLGYNGYTEFQQAMQDAIKRQLTMVERLKLSDDVYDKEEQAVYEIFNEDIGRIQMLKEQIDVTAFYDAVNMISHARRIYIIANRSAV